MFYPFLKKLANATPYTNVRQWAIWSAVYALLLLLNEHFELIEALGFSAQTLSVIKLLGVYLYMSFSTYHFYQQKKRPL
jgi:hypothetical protein